MDSIGLTRKQLDDLAGIVTRQLAFLGKLRRRMELLGFAPADPLYVSTSKAFDGVHALSVQVHRLSVEAMKSEGTPGWIGRLKSR